MLSEEDQELRDKFEDEIGPADWKSLRAHFVRGSIIIVDTDLDLIDVGIKVASDNSGQLEELINSGKLTKPTPQDAEVWEKGKFELLSIIVAPFVLVQYNIQLQ